MAPNQILFSIYRGYTTQLSLYIVGVLRKYHTIFLLNPTDVVTAFDQLSRIAYRTKLPPAETGTSNSMQDYNSAEWCILAYLYDLCNNCSTLKNRDRCRTIYLIMRKNWAGKWNVKDNSHIWNANVRCKLKIWYVKYKYNMWYLNTICVMNIWFMK